MEEGIAQIQKGVIALRAMGAEIAQASNLAWLAETHGKIGQVEDGLAVVTEALALVNKTGEHMYEAELYRLKGTLTLQQESKEQGARS